MISGDRRLCKQQSSLMSCCRLLIVLVTVSLIFSTLRLSHLASSRRKLNQDLSLNVHGANFPIHPANQTKFPITVFWHIYMSPNPDKKHKSRLEEILRRQFDALKSSKLLEVSKVYIGLVNNNMPTNPLLRKILEHPHVSVIATEKKGDECVTTEPMYQEALRRIDEEGELTDSVVFYMHSRGATHVEGTAMDLAADDWTVFMEYMLIKHWQYAYWLLISGADTVGCELWCHENRLGKNSLPPVCHYSGNFFWARWTYLAALPSPKKFASSNLKSPDDFRYLCGEDWLLHDLDHRKIDLHKHAVVHHTTDKMGVEGGGIHSYYFRYLPEYYNCSQSRVRVGDYSKIGINLPAELDRPATTPCIDIPEEDKRKVGDIYQSLLP